MVTAHMGERAFRQWNQRTFVLLRSEMTTWRHNDMKGITVRKWVTPLGALLTFLATTGVAQVRVETNEPAPIYRVVVVERTAKAINYRHRGGATKIDFRGTE